MPAVAPYIPTTDAGLDSWLSNFSTLDHRYTFRVWSACERCRLRLLLPFPLGTRNSSSFRHRRRRLPLRFRRRILRKLLLSASFGHTRKILRTIPGVSSANKIALGLNPKTSTPSPITPPSSNPILTVQSAANLSMILRYRDSAASVSVKSKPYGVKGCQIFGVASATPITDPTKLPLLIIATKSPVTVTFPSGSAGMQVYMAARWAIQTGGVSPWSPMINFTCPAAA